MNIKEQFPNYKGFYCNGFVTIKKKKYKNGWYKFENKSKKEIAQIEFESIAKSFYDSYKYDTGAGIIEDTLDKYVVNAINDKHSSKLKNDVTKFVSWFNKEFQMVHKVQIGLFKDSYYAFGNEVFVIWFGYLIGIVRYKKEHEIEHWYITDFFGKTPNSKRTEKTYNSCKNLKKDLEMKLHYVINKEILLED